MEGYVNRTKVTDLENCFEKVLSKTSAYMPPSPFGTSYVPVDTLLASQVPYQVMDFNPILRSFSVAVEEALCEVA